MTETSASSDRAKCEETYLVRGKQLHQLADEESVVAKVGGNVVLQLQDVV